MGVPSRALTYLAAAVACVLCGSVSATACGGIESAPSEDASTTSDAAGDDLASDVVEASLESAPCPPEVPAAGTPCADVGSLCEYGSCPEVFFDVVQQCQPSGWTVLLDGGFPCPRGRNPRCPPTFPDAGWFSTGCIFPC